MKSPLVKTSWLQRRLQDPDIRIVEIRGGVLPASEPPPHYFADRAGYDQAHIPNAVFIDWLVDIVEPGTPYYDIASPERFGALMGELGIGNDTTVVAYDNAASTFACRLWWALRYYGHEDVHILDGGWQKWCAEGRPVSAETPDYDRKTFVPQVNAALRATAEEIQVGIDAGEMQLIDVRSPAEFVGTDSRALHGGHIPSAINVPRRAMVTEDSTLKSTAELLDEFAELGARLDAPETVLYCNAGVSATFGMLAMEVAGAENLRIYDGSWNEWGNDASKPKETGS